MVLAALQVCLRAAGRTEASITQRAAISSVAGGEGQGPLSGPARLCVPKIRFRMDARNRRAHIGSNFRKAQDKPDKTNLLSLNLAQVIEAG